MTIPNISISWCDRKAKCGWCPEEINAGEPIVTAFYRNKAPDGGKTFNVKRYYHPQCWVEQGLDYLKRNPYVPYLRKPRMKLTKEQSKQRYRLLRRKAALDQRIRKLDNSHDRLLVETRLRERITIIMLEIAEIGGIPKKWLV